MVVQNSSMRLLLLASKVSGLKIATSGAGSALTSANCGKKCTLKQEVSGKARKGVR